MRRQRENTSCTRGPPLGHGWSPPPYAAMPHIRGYHAPPTMGYGGISADCGPLSPTLSMLSTRYPHLRCNTTSTMSERLSTMSERFSRAVTSPPRMPDPVVFNAGFTFRINEERPKVYDHVKVDPASSVPHTASFSLTKKIDRFLKKSDHTLDRFQDIIQQKKLNFESLSIPIKKIPPTKPPRLELSEEKEMPRSREPSDSSRRSLSLFKGSPPSSSSFAATAERHRRILAKVVANGALRRKRRQDDISSSSSTSSSDEDEFESESGVPQSTSGLYERSDDTSAEISKLEDLSSGSDDEYFDVHPLPGYFCIPSSQVGKDCQKSNHGGPTNVAPGNAPVKHSLIIGPSWKRNPVHSQSLPAVNKIPCPTKMGNVNIPPPVSKASQEMTPLRTHKKYPAPPPPVSREASFVSMDSLNARISLYGSQNARLGICLSASGASMNTLDSVSPRKKTHRSPSLKKYPAPQPPINSHGDTVTFTTNSLPRNHNWRNSYNSEITQVNNSIKKTISENPIPEINHVINRPGSPLPNSSTTLPVRLKPSKLNIPETKNNTSFNSLPHSLSTECLADDKEYLGIENNVELATNIKLTESESNCNTQGTTAIQLLKNNSQIIEKNIPSFSDCLVTPVSLTGNLENESAKDICVAVVTAPVSSEGELPFCNEDQPVEIEQNFNYKRHSTSENIREISNSIQQLENDSSELGEICSKRASIENPSFNQILELSDCSDHLNKNNLLNMRIGETTKKDTFSSLSVTNIIEDSNENFCGIENIESCEDKAGSKRKSLIFKESLDVSNYRSQERQGSVSKDSISSRGSRETSVSSTSSDNIDPLSRNTTDRFLIKRSKSGKLAALASKFESEDKSEIVVSSLKPNMSKGSNKFARNKISGLANIFVGDAQNKDSNKLQSPYSKPFSPESSISEKVKKNIGGIDVSKFGEVATNIKDFRPHKKSKDEDKSPIGPSIKETKSTATHVGKSNLKNDDSKLKEDVKPKLKEDVSKLKDDVKPKLKEGISRSKDDGKPKLKENLLNGECKELRSNDSGDCKDGKGNKSKVEISLKNPLSSTISMSLLEVTKPTDEKEVEHSDLSLAKKKKKKRPTKDVGLLVEPEKDKTDVKNIEVCSIGEETNTSNLVSANLEKETSITKNSEISSKKEINCVFLDYVAAKIDKKKTATNNDDISSTKEANVCLSKAIPAEIDNKMAVTKKTDDDDRKDNNGDIVNSIPTKLDKSSTNSDGISSKIETNVALKKSIIDKIDNKMGVAKKTDNCFRKETVADIVSSIPTKLDKSSTNSDGISSTKETNVDIPKSIPDKIDNKMGVTKKTDNCFRKETDAEIGNSIPTKLYKSSTNSDGISSAKETNIVIPKPVSTIIDKEKTSTIPADIIFTDQTNVEILQPISNVIHKETTPTGYTCFSEEMKVGTSHSDDFLDISLKKYVPVCQNSDVITLVKPSSDGDKIVESGSLDKSCFPMQPVENSANSTLTSVNTLICENSINLEMPPATSLNHSVNDNSRGLNNSLILNASSLSVDLVTNEKSLESKLTETKVLEKVADLIDSDNNHNLNKLTSHETKECEVSEVEKVSPHFIIANQDDCSVETGFKSMHPKSAFLHLGHNQTSVQTDSTASVNSSSSFNEKPIETYVPKLTENILSDEPEATSILNKSSILDIVDKFTSSDAIRDIIQAEFHPSKSLPQNIETSVPHVSYPAAIDLEPTPAVKVADLLSQSVLKDVAIQMNQVCTPNQKSIQYIDSNITSEMFLADKLVNESLVNSINTSSIMTSDETSRLPSAEAGNKINSDAHSNSINNLNYTECVKMTSLEPISVKRESPIPLLLNANIPNDVNTNLDVERTSYSQSILANDIHNSQSSFESPKKNSSDTLTNLSGNELNYESTNEGSTPIYLKDLPNKVNADVSINKDAKEAMLEDTSSTSIGLFQGMVNSLKTSFSKVMLNASSNSINLDDQGQAAIVDKNVAMPENPTIGSILENYSMENTSHTSPNSSSPEFHSASSSTHTVHSFEINAMKSDTVKDNEVIVGSETGARSKRSSNVPMPEEVLNVSEILREAEERLTKALEKDPLVYRFPIGKVDDVYVDAFDPSQFDILMPLPTSEDRLLLDRRSRSCTPYREGLDRRSPTPNRFVEQTEALLSETDRILRKSRSHNSLRKSFTRSMSGMNLNRLAEVTADLSEEHSTSHLAGERIEAEQAERMRLEKEVNELQGEVKRMTDTNDKLEMERLALRTEILHVELNGDIHDSDDAADAALYKRKYEWSLRELEVVKKQLKQQQEDDLDQLLILKKQLEKKICDSHEETEEQRQVATQLKKKSQRLQAEMNDMKILLEEQTSRNNLLEKKQRKFDQDVHVIQEELRNEKLVKDKIQREKDQTLSEKYSFEQEVAALKLELDLKEEKVAALTREINDLNFTGKAEEEVAILKKAKHDLELRVKDQEEELDDLAGQVQMLESARLRLEMSIEQMRKENRKEAQLREEEMEEVRVAAQKKVKAFEAQLEAEHDERTQLMREKHELERRLTLVQERTFSTVDEDAFHKVKKELKKTKALLKDTQTMLEKSQSEGSNKLLLRQLKTQLEDAEFAKTAAIKARQSAESEVAEIQSQLEEALRTKNDAEERCVRHIKEKTEMQTQLEEGEEEVAEVMKKYKATVSQLSIDQINISEQAQMIAELEHEKQVLQERLTELSSKVEVLEGETANIHTQRRLQMKIKELESKLDLESTTRQRLESQITRLKDQVERLCSECDSAKCKETQTQDFCKKLNRQLREAKEDLTNIQQKHTDATGKKQEVEKQLELAESEIITLKSDLKLAFKRIEDLQQALQGDLSDSDTELTDSDSESETSLTSYLTASASQDRPLSNSTAQTTENESLSESKMMELMVCSPTANLMSSIRDDLEEDYKESFA